MDDASFDSDGILIYPYISTIASASSIKLWTKLGMIPLVERKPIRITEYTGVLENDASMLHT